MKHILRFLLVYLALSCFIVLAAGYFFFTPPEMPYGGSGEYRIAESLLLFFDILPAILCAGFVCGASRAFGAAGKNYRPHFSPSIMQGFQQTIICVIIGTALVFATKEIGTPLLTRAQQKKLLQSEYINEYIAYAKRHIEDGEFILAEKYAQYALKIAPKNSSVLDLYARVEYGLAEMQTRETPESRSASDSPSIPQILPGEENYTVFELLQKARDAYEKEFWFDAHFYANSVTEITTERDPNYATAKRIAAEAWNKVANPGVFVDLQTAVFFEKKREAYRALTERDDLRAYYLFEDLHEKNANDTDVERYLRIADERVRTKYFFLNEVPDIELFLNIENVYFSIDNPNGEKDIVSIKGMAPLEDSGKAVIFLRGLSILSYNAGGDFEMSLYAPFAKMYAQPASDFDERTRHDLGVSGKNRSVPCIMLEGVDSRTGEIVMQPDFLFVEEKPSLQLNLKMLAMPYSDLTVLIDSTRDIVSIASLFKFAPMAEKYGFSKEVFLHSLYTRIAYPLIFVIVMLFAAVAAWNFRLESKTYFKLLWVLIPPVLTALIYLIIEMSQFFVSVAIYSAIKAVPAVSFALVIVSFAVLFVAATLLFVSRRDVL